MLTRHANQHLAQLSSQLWKKLAEQLCCILQVHNMLACNCQRIHPIDEACVLERGRRGQLLAEEEAND